MTEEAHLERAIDSERGVPQVHMDDRLAIIQDISLALNSTLDPDLLIERILDASIRYTGATTGSVILIQPDRTLRIMASRGLGANVQEVRLKVGEGITGWVAQHGQPLNVPDVRGDKRYVCLKEHIRSELAVPMVLDRKTIGVISVDSTKISNFAEEDLQLLTIVGTQAAQILENAKAFADLRRKMEQDETLLEISQVLGSALDFNELFQRVGEINARRCSMRRSFLVLLNPESDELSIELAYGLTSEEMSKGRYRIGEGITGRVVKTGKPIGVKDIAAEPKFLGRTGTFPEDGEKLSFLAVPVYLEGRVVGVLGAVKPFPGDAQFEEDMALLKIISSALTPAVKIHFGVAREKELLLRENRLLKEELKTLYHFDNLVGSSPVMVKVYETIHGVSRGRSTVLIRGESGTGKELIAHAIHFNSPRAEKPFVRVNCAAIPESLLEAELFGHVKGSFTGAIADRKGKFALADGGTIFLDEIGDMSPLLQVKILRVLQEREFEAVGSDAPQKVDVRVIAATNRNLEEMLLRGEFREDLYYRLNVVPVVVPPLRDRPEDIPPLVEHFLQKFRKENQLPDLAIDPEAIRMLTRYRWPGNVRELENVIERATILCDGKLIRSSDLPLLPQEGLGGRMPKEPVSFEESLEAYIRSELSGLQKGVWERSIRLTEKALLQAALSKADGVRLKAADLLGIHRNTLRKKLEELKLEQGSPAAPGGA